MAKHVDLSLAEKSHTLLRDLEAPGATQANITKQFGVSTSQVILNEKMKSTKVQTYLISTLLYILGVPCM